ncbi:MAG: PDZ domain-containing protein [Phycisphaerales bacterium]|nr:PDZ domain-containing protein [Phycisphaerales bacterium]
MHPATIARVGLLLLAPASFAQPAGGVVFDEACQTIRDEFYDPGLHGVDWDSVRDRLHPAAAAATTPEAISAVINEALDTLHASHTHHYHQGQAAYYELLDAFSPKGGSSYLGIGITTREIEGRNFIEDVYPGGPAAEAGLLVGDEIVSVAGRAWADVASFQGGAGGSTPIEVRRDGPQSEPRQLLVTPRQIQPHELFLDSIRASAREVPVDGALIAYVRVRSYASSDYQEALMDLVTGALADADALVLDIRGGWGGARAAYMALANPAAPGMQFRPRGEDWRNSNDAWHKPLVLLIDGESAGAQ